MPIITAAAKPGSTLQHDKVVAMRFGLDLLNLVKIDEDKTTDARELIMREVVFQGGSRRPQQMGLVPDVQLNVIIR